MDTDTQAEDSPTAVQDSLPQEQAPSGEPPELPDTETNISDQFVVHIDAPKVSPPPADLPAVPVSTDLHQYYLNYPDLPEGGNHILQEQSDLRFPIFSPDPQRNYAARANLAAISLRLNVPPENISEFTYPIWRDHFAQINFGKSPVTDKAFFTLNKQRAQAQQSPPPLLDVNGAVPENPTSEASLIQLGRDYADTLRQSHPNMPQHNDNQLLEIGKKLDTLRQLQQQARDAETALHQHSFAGNAFNSAMGGMTDTTLAAGQGFYTKAAQQLREAFPYNETARSIADEYERYSQRFDETREHYRNVYDVNPQFADSFMGKLLHGAGSLVPQSVAASLPGIGLLALDSQGFQQGWDDAKQTAERRNEKFDPEKAYAYAASSGAINALMAKAKVDA
ncbi:MAG: hypothetical protein ABIP97_10835, partial [Chthoniobacterales bacterium]